MMHEEPVLISGLGVPFTSRSAIHLSERLFGQQGRYPVILVADARGVLSWRFTVIEQLQPGLVFDRLGRVAYFWQADLDILAILKASVIDLGDPEGPLLLAPPERTAAATSALSGASVVVRS